MNRFPQIDCNRSITPIDAGAPRFIAWFREYYGT